MENGQTSETDWSYNSDEMQTEKDEYDYGSGAAGALIRATKTPTYQTFASLTHVVDKPTQVTIKDSSGAAARTDFSYDASGNTAKVSRWIDATGNNTAATQFLYDQYGNLTQVTDPKTNITQYSYSDSHLRIRVQQEPRVQRILI